MLVKDILKTVGLNIALPTNLLNEELENVIPENYTKTGNKYVIYFKDSTFRITINADGSDEFFIMTESFENIPDIYVSYTVDGNLHTIS